jgi:hypothetical protein
MSKDIREAFVKKAVKSGLNENLVKSLSNDALFAVLDHINKDKHYYC